MPSFHHLPKPVIAGLLGLLLCPAPAMQGRSNPTPARDGQHDFDFELGSWKIHLKRLKNPLTGSNTWDEFDGTSVTRKVWDGRADIEEFETDGPGGHVEGMTLRLYNPQSHQWSLFWANAKDGVLSQPTIGEFRDGVGEFIDQEPYKGRAILVRYLWSNITSNSAHFEQSFSDDGGKTWEANWITDQTRVKEEPASDTSVPKNETQDANNDHAHDFDFEFGTWKTHLRRLLRPLTASKVWVDYDGTSTVRKIWNGRANLGELEVSTGNTHVEGLTLRLYHPQSHQWSLYWANSSDGILNAPAVGQFKDNRGEFFDQEDFQEKSIFVRFVFSDLTQNTFRGEQSFSPDGGKTWEPNWISTFTRETQ